MKNGQLFMGSAVSIDDAALTFGHRLLDMAVI